MMAKYLSVATLCAAMLLSAESIYAQCSGGGGGRGGGMGAGVATGFAGGQVAGGFVGTGLGNSGFTAGGNPQVFAMMLQMQRQNQLMQQQLLAMRQQMLQLQRQNQQLMAQLQSTDSAANLVATRKVAQNTTMQNSKAGIPAGTQLASTSKVRTRKVK